MDTITLNITVPRVVTRKVAGHSFDFDFGKAKPEVLAWQLLYGFRGVNDAANGQKSVVTEKGEHPDKWTLADSRAYVDSWFDGSIAEKASRGAGASVLDPVAEAARQLACADIIARLGVRTWKEAAQSAKGAKYFKLSDKGNVARVTEAVDDYIKRADEAQADEAKRYTTRAKVIVEAKSGDAVEVDL